MKKVLLVNPPSEALYAEAKIHLYRAHARKKIKTVPYSPVLSLATIAAKVIESGHEVKLIDLNLSEADLDLTLKSFNPDVVGITFTTGLFYEMLSIAKTIKSFNPNILLIGGGAHASSFPDLTLKQTPIDIVVVGEADFVFSEIINNNQLSKIRGIAYKKDNRIIINKSGSFIKNLDDVPLPAWHIYDLKRYKVPRAIAKKNPVGWLETSRGCPYSCVYCNKSIFGRAFRVKSPKRVVDEIEFMLDSGFREIHIADDGFTTDMKRAGEVCDEIIRRNLRFPWATVTGIRADRVDEKLLKKMRQAGCYRVFFGIESGNQKILDLINKNQTLDQVRNAVHASKNSGLEVYGFFMLGLPGETEKSMQDTINFAKSLPLDMAKTSIMVPLPATPIYDDLKSKGLLKNEDWHDFNLYRTPRNLYDHPNVSWDLVEHYYTKFYKEFYYRPSFILNRIRKGLFNGNLLFDAYYFLKNRF